MNTDTLANALKAVFGSAATPSSSSLIPFADSSRNPAGFSSISALAAVMGVTIEQYTGTGTSAGMPSDYGVLFNFGTGYYAGQVFMNGDGVPYSRSGYGNDNKTWNAWTIGANMPIYSGGGSSADNYFDTTRMFSCGSTTHNVPTEGTWYFIVSITLTSTVCLQFAFHEGDSKLYTRNYSDGAWTSWREL